MQLQNRISLTIEPSKPFTFGHQVVLLGGFGDVAHTWRWVTMLGIFFLFSLFLPFRCVSIGFARPETSSPRGTWRPDRQQLQLRSPLPRGHERLLLFPAALLPASAASHPSICQRRRKGKDSGQSRLQDERPRSCRQQR